jgi:hypothetical protein
MACGRPQTIGPRFSHRPQIGYPRTTDDRALVLLAFPP